MEIANLRVIVVDGGAVACRQMVQDSLVEHRQLVEFGWGEHIDETATDVRYVSGCRLLDRRPRHAIHGAGGPAAVQRWRLVFMTGSIVSVRGCPAWSVYAASKAALHAYARVWPAELKDRRIRVNVLSPGQVVATGREETFDDETKAAMEAREALIPRAANGRPEEIATVALFLASDDSSFVKRYGVDCRRGHHRSLTPGVNTAFIRRDSPQWISSIHRAERP